MNDILLFSVQFFSWVFVIFCCCTLITTIEELQASAVQFFIYFIPFNFIIGLFFTSLRIAYLSRIVIVKQQFRLNITRGPTLVTHFAIVRQSVVVVLSQQFTLSGLNVFDCPLGVLHQSICIPSRLSYNTILTLLFFATEK